MSVNAIILQGPTASGKGTIARYVRHFGIKCANISAGNLLHARSQRCDKLGLYIGMQQAESQFVDSSVVKEIILEEVKNLHKVGVKFLFLDGYPRNVTQLKDAIELLKGAAVSRWVLQRPIEWCEEMAFQPDRLDRHDNKGKTLSEVKADVLKRFQRYLEIEAPTIDSLFELIPKISSHHFEMGMKKGFDKNEVLSALLKAGWISREKLAELQSTASTT